MAVTLDKSQISAGMYSAFWDRAPDATGQNFWVGKLNAGAVSQLEMATFFYNSPEGLATYPNWIRSDNAALVTQAYSSVFERAPDDSGLAFYVAQLESGTSFPQVVLNMIQNALSLDNADSAQFLNEIQVGIFVSQTLRTDDPAITGVALQGVTADPASVTVREAQLYEMANPPHIFTLTTNPDIATSQNFYAPMAYTPGGNDLVNTLQNEDILTGDTTKGATTLVGTLGNVGDNGYHVVAPSITDVETINIAFTNTTGNMVLDFQDINGTTTANVTRISNSIRDGFTNLHGETVNLGIANTAEQARFTGTYLNNELAAANNAVTVTLNKASLAGSVADLANGGALKIVATDALGADLQNQIETYNIVTEGTSGSNVATFETGVSDFNDLVHGQRPVTVNVATGNNASLAIGTLRWLGNRIENSAANTFQTAGLHQVLANGVGFINISQINNVTYTGGADLTLANVGTWESLSDTNTAIDFTLNAATATGNLTANISNAAMSADANFIGGLGSDRFYAAGLDTVSSGTITPVAVNVAAFISGGVGVGVDSLTVQSNAGGTINLDTGSANLDFLNAVQGINTVATANWAIDLADGGFGGVTFNNQDNNTMINTLTNFNAGTTALSVRSTGLNADGDPATTAQGEVDILFTQAAGLVGGTLDLQVGGAFDDRGITNAFSYTNYTSTIGLVDNGAQGSTEVDSLDLEVNSAGASGTGALQLNVALDDFETATTLTSAINATNTVNIGQQISSLSSDYSAAPLNALNSTTYDGSAYAGSQNVTFGGVAPTAVLGKSHNITTGTAADRVDLSYMTTAVAAAPNQTVANWLQDQKLLGTVINMGGGNDELVLSATLADPRMVVAQDPTYDGYFQNWSNIETLTINNRNAINSAYVAFDAYAQNNNANLGTVNFTDVSGTLDVGFRFTNDLTVNVDAAGAAAAGVQPLKTTTILSQSESDLTLNVDESYGLTTGVGAVGNYVAFTSTGASLGNNVALNYRNISNNGGTYNGTTLSVAAGSLDTVTWYGDLGYDITGTAGASGAISVTTNASWTENTQTTTYDFRNVTNIAGTTSAGTVTFDGSAEVAGITVYGSNAGAGLTTSAVINNTITGGSGNDVISSAGYQDVLNGGAGNDTITYTGSPVALTATANTVSITGGTGNDTISVNLMTAGETATVNAGAGNDVVTLGLESDTYVFANVATVTISTAATVAQTQANVGTDQIANYNVASDVINLSSAVFGTAIGANTAAFATDHYQQVTATNAIIGGTGLTTGGIVVVQAGANADASIFYVDQTVTAGLTNVDTLVQSGHATLIGQVTNVTGSFAAGEFAVVA